MSPRDADPGAPQDRGRVDNGLLAAAYVPLTDVDADVGHQLLTALGRARIAAYLSPGAAVDAETRERQRLFVASDDRVDARTIVAATVRAMGAAQPDLPRQRNPWDEVDTDSAFQALVADWHVDTVAAVRDAERDLSREDADWRARLVQPQAPDEVSLDEDHYVPPAPPPLPRLAAPTVIGMIVLVLAILVLALGGEIGLGSDVSLVLGISGLVLAAGIFFTRVRDHRGDEDDDGSAV